MRLMSNTHRRRRHDATRLHCWQICSDSLRLSPSRPSCELCTHHRRKSTRQLTHVGGVYWELEMTPTPELLEALSPLHIPAPAHPCARPYVERIYVRPCVRPSIEPYCSIRAFPDSDKCFKSGGQKLKVQGHSGSSSGRTHSTRHALSIDFLVEFGACTDQTDGRARHVMRPRPISAAT